MTKRILQAIVAIVLISPLVFGESKTFTWIPPLEYEDGTPLFDGDIKEYTLSCDSGLEVIIKNEGKTNSWISRNTEFEPGIYTCWVTATAVNNLTSDHSNYDQFAVRFEVIPTPSNGSSCSF